MRYSLHVSRRASTYLDRCQPDLRRRILARLEDLTEDPLNARLSKPLRDPAGRRVARVGDFRIIFSVDGQDSLILVSEIGPRGQIYRNL